MQVVNRKEWAFCPNNVCTHAAENRFNLNATCPTKAIVDGFNLS